MKFNDPTLKCDISQKNHDKINVNVNVNVNVKVETYLFSKVPNNTVCENLDCLVLPKCIPMRRPREEN